MIYNPNPITAGTFNGYWIRSANFVSDKSFVQASLLPYDGTHLLATGGKIVNKQDAGLVASVAAEAKRLAGKDIAVKLVNVLAQDPAKPVVLNVVFADGTRHTEKDCFAKAREDEAFASAFSAALAGIAALAGLEVA